MGGGRGFPFYFSLSSIGHRRRRMMVTGCFVFFFGGIGALYGGGFCMRLVFVSCFGSFGHCVCECVLVQYPTVKFPCSLLRSFSLFFLF